MGQLTVDKAKGHKTNGYRTKGPKQRTMKIEQRTKKKEQRTMEKIRNRV
jgi:hypothetical protein